ncbi:phytanoyl-CoA dioxygenase family protein [Nocardia wallacei]|uniref:phytanoyl-CoA dioxygenase family protein n=1 Tax=Nocardia wallacei TaxID=480035 RepID=UPI0024578D98|nr:phytanoyl-CoA dioxygenase family protein [Nocardia wallacei]
MTAHLLTGDERRQWAELGYLHLRRALGTDEVAHLHDAVMTVHSRIQEIDSLDRRGDFSCREDVFDAGNERDLSIANAIAHVETISTLLDHRAAFGKILGLMGPYLQMLGSEIFYRYPHEHPLVDFHTDLGPSLRLATPGAGKEIQLKAQFFLTDMPGPDCGNFTVAPGSHTAGFPGKIAYADVEGPIQLVANAGDVVIFPLSLGHGVAPNRTDAARVSIVLRYGQIFCRPVDYRHATDELMNRLSPRQRRLLGDFGARQRPGDVYGAIPDQLALIYGQEWSSTVEAQADIQSARIDQLAYETL